MSAPLTAAEAWALASKVALIDARHCDPLESAEKRAESAALLDRARELDDDVCLLLRADDYMWSEVKPAAHFHAPHPVDARAVVDSLRGKPTRRRGTKPTSLPECLSRAAMALKEP